MKKIRVICYHYLQSALSSESRPGTNKTNLQPTSRFESKDSLRRAWNVRLFAEYPVIHYLRRHRPPHPPLQPDVDQFPVVSSLPPQSFPETFSFELCNLRPCLRCFSYAAEQQQQHPGFRQTAALERLSDHFLYVF